MAEVKAIVQLEHGLHARPASDFIKLANSFSSEIRITKNNKQGNGKSIMSLLSLAITKGTEVTLEAVGNDEVEAVERLRQFLEN